MHDEVNINWTSYPQNGNFNASVMKKVRGSKSYKSHPNFYVGFKLFGNLLRIIEMRDITDNNHATVRNDDVVISGISGRFPKCNNMQEYKENLFSKMDLLTEGGRWKLDHPEIPKCTGIVNDVEQFDADYFNITCDQARGMNPGSRMILEHTHEALVDAGINPVHLRNTRTAVVVATSYCESETMLLYEDTDIHGEGIPGCSKSMSANRISSWLNLSGPSFNIDTACSSSFYALEYAYRAIKNGQCDAAIVGGMNLCLEPSLSLQFNRLGLLSPDGKCKPFDDTANGYVRSETIAVTFLQKAKDAKRIYATFVHAKTNCDGFKKYGITFPSSELQACLLREFYEECGVPTTCVSYMEAHGTGTKVGDPEEVNAIDKILCPGRLTPLKIGSIKSNLGHAECASGMCAVAKIIVAMECGLIPPNLHCNTPKKSIDALVKGRIQVVTEPTPWECDYAAASSFGFGGANGHVLFKSNPEKLVNNGLPKDGLPRLVCVSGRTTEAVNCLLDELESRPVNAEHVALLHDVHADNIPGHPYRGYTIVGPEGALYPHVNEEIRKCNNVKREIWFVFSGIGCQWPGMGIDLLRFPVFAETIKTCDAVLKPLGVNIYDILTSTKEDTLDIAINSFVGIIAVEVGLVNLLSLVGSLPDKIIGYGIGELACAYASRCLTIEQTILVAYYSASTISESKVICGSMAIVELGYNNLQNVCPPDVEIACQNGQSNSVIIGPAEIVKPFLADLQSKNIIVQELPSSCIPLNSRYMAVAEQKLLSSLKAVIADPKPRPLKWLSTAIPREEWSTSKAHLFSAEYFSYSLLRPVLLEQTLAMVPKDAVVIEVSPDGILQSILRKAVPHNVTNIIMSERGREDNVELVLNCLGKLYTQGFQPQIQKMYPKVSYPVSRGTPSIAPFIKWEHSRNWPVLACRYIPTTWERYIYVTTRNESFEYMNGHIIDGRNLLPATGYLDFVWHTLGLERGELLYTVVPVVFENVKFLRATTISNDNTIMLTVSIQKATGLFEVVDGDAVVCTGKVFTTSNPSDERFKTFDENIIDEPEAMKAKDVYKEFRLRGYNYSGLFCSIKSASVWGTRGHISWKNNWAAFLDNMLQMKLLGIDTRQLLVPTEIGKIVIDVKKHLSDILSLPSEDKILPVRIDKELDIIESGGIEIRGLSTSVIARKRPAYNPVLEQYKFVPYIDRTETSLSQALQTMVHIALENCLSSKIRTIELVSENDNVTHESLASPLISEILGNLPLIEANIAVIAPIEMFERNAIPEDISLSAPNAFRKDKNVQLAVGYNLLCQKDNLKSLKLLLTNVQNDGFLLSRETTDDVELASILSSETLSLISQKKVGKEQLILLRKKVKIPKKAIAVHINNEDFTWVPRLQNIMQKEIHGRGNLRIYLVSEKNVDNGLLGFANCLRRESGGNTIRVVLIQDLKALEFSLEDPFYAEQLQLDLAFNVLRPGNIWGSYRHLSLSPLTPQPVYHATVYQTTRGNMDSLGWFEGPIRENVEDSKLTRIYYASINFKDIMLASGKLSVPTETYTRKEQDSIGFEYSGINCEGRRIMGLINVAALSNCCIADTDLTWQVPDHWTLEDAATVPGVYATCYYALYYTAKMKKGDKILIHAGSGGVGQAAINLALHEGCEIFTTVGTPEKRRFLRLHFPQIPDDHIGNSRDTSFEQMVMEHTDGKGVDIVLNSLAEEKLQASVRCLARNGQFLEIGKFDMMVNNTLPLEVFTKGIGFYGVMLDAVFHADRELKKTTLQSLLADCIKSGAVKPLVRSVFPKDKVTEAFRFMAAGKHIGKVIVKIRDEHEPIKTSMIAFPRYYCYDDRSYIIFGGLGGFGLELADWLVLRGAQYLILVSRKGVRNGYQRRRVSMWEHSGVRIEIMVVEDAWERERCDAILRKANSLAPVDGIFNLAVVLSDNLFENQTTEAFEDSFKGKVGITKQLDDLSRKLCPQLRHFVVFSSVSCGRGNIGQTNYGMANSIMERICERRVAEGLHGLAVQWGAVGDVGLVADMQEFHKEVVIGGTLQQSISSCLQELDGFLRQSNAPVVSSMVVAEKRSGTGVDIVGTVLNILGIKDIKSISPQVSLTELGMDSMSAIEIKQSLERDFEIFLSPQEIRSLNFAKLKELDKTSDNEENSTVKTVKKIQKLALKNLIHGSKETYLHPTRICFELPTQNQSTDSEMFIIPGIEGFSKIFNPLAPKIRYPTTSLQLGVEYENLEDIETMANKFWLAMIDRCNGPKDFTLIGYSFGAMIAIELARKFESKGFMGRVILIDGAPELFKSIMECMFPATSISELESIILVEFMNMVAPEMSARFAEMIVECVTWKEKLNTLLQLIPINSETLSREGLGNFCTAICKRIIATRKYCDEKKVPIKSPIVLIKPTMPMIHSLPEDYGLHKVTEGKIEIYTVESDHKTILESDKVAAIINGDTLAEKDLE